MMMALGVKQVLIHNKYYGEKMNYYLTDTLVSAYVNYKILDKYNNTIKDYSSSPCFSQITYGKIPSDATAIEIRHKISYVPYTVDSIKRWITDINECGFPCTFIEDITSDSTRQLECISSTVFNPIVDIAQKLMFHQNTEVDVSDKEYYYFKILLSDFKYKSHFISTLMLIRTIFENYICRIPEIYFRMLDIDSSLDKFDSMQTAHKKLDDYSHNHNKNHMITFKGNGENITKTTLINRYKKCGFKIMDGEEYINHYLNQSSKWNGG